MRRILISRTDAIGDLLLTLPVVRSIKSAVPDSELTLLVSEYTRPLLANENYVDDVLIITGRSVGAGGPLYRLTRTLISHHFDTALFVYPRLGLALAGLLAGIDSRVGTAYRGYSFLFNQAVKLHRQESGKHELDLNYELAESVFPNLERLEPALTVSDAQLGAALSCLEQAGLTVPSQYVIIHPLSRGSAPNWRLTRYLELADRLADAGVTVILTGSGGERQEIEAAQQARGSRHLSLAGATDLATLIGLISQAAAVVSGSTGPIHIATAVGTPAVGIYPPERALSAVRWEPRGGSCRLFVPPTDASVPSSGDPMDTITVAAVVAYLLSKPANGAKLADEQRNVEGD